MCNRRFLPGLSRTLTLLLAQALSVALCQVADASAEQTQEACSGGTEYVYISNEDSGDISVISSPYRRDGASVGSFGIVGPTRMDYKKYIPLVGFAADMLSDILDGRLPGASKGS